jgi:hypothetical protein
VDAWETLLQNSLAADGSDAWEHLNAQSGESYPVYVEGVLTVSNIETLTMAISTEIKNVAVFGE